MERSRFGLWVGVPLVVVALTLGACSDSDGGAGASTAALDIAPVRTTIPVDQLGDFALGELEALGVVTNRIIEWVVLGDGRYVAFAQPAGEARGARVRLLDRSRAKIRTVDAELGSVSALLPAGGDLGIAYLSTADGSRSISFVEVAGDPVDLVSVLEGTTEIDSMAVDPSQERVVWREIRQGGIQVLVSSDLDGGSVVLDETMTDGTIGEGVEAPIVLTGEGTVRYYADPEGDGDATWFEVPIDGGERTEVSDS